MHEELIFPIECRYKQVVWGKYITRQEVMSSASNNYSEYDAMDDISIIPSLVALVSDNPTARQREGVIKKWIRQYGFLTSPNRSSAEGFEWKEENLETFWNKAKQLANLWDIYRMVTNRELEELKKIVKFDDVSFPFDPGNTEGSLYPDGVPPPGQYHF